MILVDTSVWIDFLRGVNSRERRLLHRLIEDEEDIAITEIIFLEILQGIKRNTDFNSMREFLLDFPLFSPNGIDTYLYAANIYRDCRRRGKTVRKTVDCIIAAICIENDLVLLHKDTDFNVIAENTELKIVKI